MAFLMLLHEKLRLQRKINKLTLRQLKASSRKERMTKSIARIQKMYSTRQTKLQKWAQIYQSQFNVWSLNSAGLGGQNLNPAAYGMAGGMSAFFMNGMKEWLDQSSSIKNKDGSCIFGDGQAEALLNAKQSGTLTQNYIDDPDNEGKKIVDKENPYTDGQGNTFTSEQVSALSAGMNQVNMMEQMRRADVQQMQQMYQNRVSIWLEQAEAQLEAEQDAMLAPLEEQETEWDMEAQSCETQLADARARLDGIKQALSEGIKDSAPTFGLG